MKKLKRSHKFMLGLMIALVIVIVGISITLNVLTYQASPEAQQIHETADVGETSNWLRFVAQGESKNRAVIFYQGALVATESYSLWAEKVAEAGYDVYLLKSPAALAILNIDLAETFLKENPATDFVIGGHSLGGVVASRFAHQQLENSHLKGVFFLASYPDQKGSLASSQLPVLSLTGSEDGVLNQERFKEAKKELPPSTVFKEISGGNHAGFGSYGAQKGDNKALIKNSAQQTLIAEMLLEWLAKIG